MSNRIRILAALWIGLSLVGLAALGAPVSAAPLATNPDPADFIPGELIIAFDQNSDAAAAAISGMDAVQWGDTPTELSRELNAFVLRVPAGEELARAGLKIRAG